MLEVARRLSEEYELKQHLASRPLGWAGAALLAATLTAPAVAAGPVTVVVDGQNVPLSPEPITREGRVFVPLRGIFERLGATVVYSAGTINATAGNRTISLHIGSTSASVNGEQ